MGGRRIRRGTTRSVEELVRLACSTDPQEPPSRPRRAALAPRAAIVAGLVLIAVALVLAGRAVLLGPAQDDLGAAATSPHPSPTTSGTPAPSGGTLAPTDPLAPPTSSSQTPSGDVVVHVAGAVASPGVVTLPAGSRVVDAVEAAGGALVDADTAAVNLARLLLDGEQVRIPHEGEDPSTWPAAADSQATQTGTGPGGVSAASGLVNINTADAAALETLPGIGPALAQRIVDYRQAHGPFSCVDDLTDVSGIGPAKLEALREAAAV